MQPTPVEQQTIFIYCSHATRDQYSCNRLGKNLAHLIRNNKLILWDQTCVRPGSDWKIDNTEILKKASIILLMVSPDFISSDYCIEVEVEQAMRQHIKGISQVIPIIIRPTDWHLTPFGNLAPLPTNGKSIKQWRCQDEAWLHVSLELGKIIGATAQQFRSMATNRSSRTARIEITIDGYYDDMTNEKIERILAEIKRITNDNAIIIHRLLNGSIKIVLNGTAGAADRIDNLFQAHQLTNIVGYRVSNVNITKDNDEDTVLLSDYNEKQILVADSQMKQIYRQMEQYSHDNLPVIVLGESGVGKDTLALYTHYASKRSGGLVSLNATSMSYDDRLIEAMLVGSARGSFIGDTPDHLGFIFLADNGTLLIKNLAEIPHSGQVTLARAIRDKSVTPLGRHEAKYTDFKLICCERRDIENELVSGRMSEHLFDLFESRIIRIPPLRRRRSEIVPLAGFFLKKACESLSREQMVLSDNASQVLISYDWPRNVRELQVLMTRIAQRKENTMIDESDVKLTLELIRKRAF